MPEWEYRERPVGDDQKCVGCGGYPEGCCGEGVEWDGKWSQGVFCRWSCSCYFSV